MKVRLDIPARAISALAPSLLGPQFRFRLQPCRWPCDRSLDRLGRRPLSRVQFSCVTQIKWRREELPLFLP